MPNTCCHITIGVMAVLYNLLFSPTFFSQIPPGVSCCYYHVVDIYTSHHSVACVVDTKYLNELVPGIRFPAKPASLKHYVGILSSKFQSFPPLHLPSCCSRPHLQCELLSSILDNINVIR